jgi:alpha-L-arabinofuranosidase
LTAKVEGVPNLDDKKKALNISSTLDKKVSEVILKAVNVTKKVIEVVINLRGVDKVGPDAKVILLSSEKLTDENSLAEPKKIYPKQTIKKINRAQFSYAFKPCSLTVLRIPVK